MKQQQRLIVGIVLTLVLIIFALLNGQSVTVNFFGAMVHWPLIVVIVVSVLIGAIIAWLASKSWGNKAKTPKKNKVWEIKVVGLWSFLSASDSSLR